jgi:hypothetical protein
LLIVTPALLLALIHRSAWKWNSTKFVLTIGPVLYAIHPSAWKGNSPKFITASNALATVGMVYLGDAPATSRDL